MNRYELVYIVRTDMPDDALSELIERYQTLITNLKGSIVKTEKWGTRKLAYEIKKHTKGTYMLMDFVGTTAVVPEVERNLKIDDMILKFMTVKKEDDVDLEELEKAKEAEKPVEEQKAAPASDTPESASESIPATSVDEESAGDMKGDKE